MLAAVILAQLLGEIVVAVDQRRRLEDAVDPRLDLGVDLLGGAAGGDGGERRGDEEWLVCHGRGFRNSRCGRAIAGLALCRAPTMKGRDERTLKRRCGSTPTRASPISTSISTG